MKFLVSILLLTACCHLQARAECTPAINVEGKTAIFCGAITYDSPEDVQAILDTNEIDTFVVTSGGGNVYSAIQIIDALNARNINVTARAKCLSACAQYIIALANSIEIEPNTAIGFHQNPFGTWEVMLASGLIDEPESDYWQRLRLFAWRSAVAYEQHGADPFLLLESALQLGISCVLDVHSKEYSDRTVFNRGFRTNQSKKWWVPSRDLINSYRHTDIKGWWPSNLEEVDKSYADNEMDVETRWITYTDAEGVMGLDALRNIDIKMCDGDTDAERN